jgi:hypothetical protein
LTIENFFKFAKEHPQVLEYFPDERDWDRLPRKYVADVIHSVIGDPFVKFIESFKNARNLKITQKDSVKVQLREDLVKILQKTHQVSSRY